MFQRSGCVPFLLLSARPAVGSRVFRGSATFAFVTARGRAFDAGHSIAVRPLDEICRATVKRSRSDGAQVTMLA